MIIEIFCYPDFKMQMNLYKFQELIVLIFRMNKSPFSYALMLLNEISNLPLISNNKSEYIGQIHRNHKRGSVKDVRRSSGIQSRFLFIEVKYAHFTAEVAGTRDIASAITNGRTLSPASLNQCS